MSLVRDFVLRTLVLIVSISTSLAHPECFPVGAGPGLRSSYRIPSDELKVPEFTAKVSGKIWRNAYIHLFTGTETFPAVDAVELRFLFDFDGTNLTSVVTYRPDTASSCVSEEATYTLDADAVNTATFNEYGSESQVRFFSDCLNKYLWVWTCDDKSTMQNNRCQSTGHLGLFVKGSDKDRLPFTLAAWTLRRNLRFYMDETFHPTQDGNTCPDPAII